MPLISFITSVLIHICVALVVIFMPEGNLNIVEPKDSYQVSLVMGAPGGENLPSPVLGVRAPNAPNTRPTPSQVENIASPQTAAPKAAPEISNPAVATPNAPNTRPTPSQVENIASPQTAAPKAAPEISNPAVATPNAPNTRPTPSQVENIASPQTAAPKATPEISNPAVATPKPQASPSDILAKALADSSAQAKNTAPRNPARNNANTLASALSDLQKEATQGGGGGGQGDGEGGGGIYDVYAAQVILAVRPNWGYASAVRNNIAVQVSVEIDPTGRVLECKIVKSSGRPDFDASAVNAVIRTKDLPAPPTPAQQSLIVTFNSSELR